MNNGIYLLYQIIDNNATKIQRINILKAVYFFADLCYIAVVVTEDLLALNYTGVGANDFVKLGIVKNFCHKTKYMCKTVFAGGQVAVGRRLSGGNWYAKRTENHAGRTD